MAKKKNKQNKNKAQYQRATVDGITFKIDMSALDDIELVEKLGAVTDGTNPFGVAAVMREVLGEDGYKRAKEHCRNESTGRTPASELGEFFAQIILAAAPNSGSSQHS